MIKKTNDEYFFSEEIERIINKNFPINHLVKIPGESSYCKYLSERWGIYILFAKKNILYIGLSSDLGSRLNKHFHNYGDKIKSVGIIRLNYKDWFEGEAIETGLINNFKPLYNKKISNFSSKSIPSDFNIDKTILKIEEIISIN